MIGKTFSHFKILEKLGEGGMGVLYLALDTHLDRPVAIKLLRPEAVGSSERKQRFVREAKAASALDHPNIVTIHDIDQTSFDGVERDFIVMEYVRGRSLAEILSRRAPESDTAMRYAIQIAEALAAAHEAGIVHRDIKPANIMVTDKGQVKVVDFGLAKLLGRGDVDHFATTHTEGLHTEQGAVLGTAAYMSPEQAEGKPVDPRSDVFSLGVVLYEMLSGEQPFKGDSHVSLRIAILQDEPPPLARKGIAPELSRIVQRCLDKRKEARYASGAELLEDLRLFQSHRVSFKAVLGKPGVAVAASIALIAAIAVGGWVWVERSRVRWARNVALPEIARLRVEGDYLSAFRLIRRAKRFIPNHPELQRLANAGVLRASVITVPSGADVYWRSYLDIDEPWEYAGKSPVRDVEVPDLYIRWKVTKDDFLPAERISFHLLQPELKVTLDPEGDVPPGMVRIPRGPGQTVTGTDPIELGEYWIDKYEVTNAQFQEFVDAGGYENPEFWKEPFIKDGPRLSFGEATDQFRDATDRPGPATWEVGTYPKGEADSPVGGVSWYEANAYARFAGKSLPTTHHWYKAAGGRGSYFDIHLLSNFGSSGPAAVGSHEGVTPFGAHDMAGNVKEWCWNRSGNRRYLLGGGWNEPSYTFRVPDAQSPFQRLPNFGFRCVKYIGPVADVLLQPVEAPAEVRREGPVGDEIFRVYKSLYSYDRGELNEEIEAVDDSWEHWRREKVSFDAAYGDERVSAYLYLPKNAALPYQTVIYFPGAGAFYSASHEREFELRVDFLVRSGRAVLFPTYKWTYDRGDSSLPETTRWRFYQPEARNAWRDLVIHWYKDLGRAIDYLESRDDIDLDRLAFYGYSTGAAYGPIFTALEKRFKTSVLVAGGFYGQRDLPEVEAVHFAPRSTIPVIMINGRHDFVFPLESAQLPLFQLFGTPEDDKRHVLLDVGHIPPRVPVIKEILDWLDRYLGPVKFTKTSG